MGYSTRPLSDRSWLRPAAARVNSQFDTEWSKTLTQLHKEVDALDGRNLVIECDVEERDLKLNGELRANARPSSPAVVVAFDTTKHGPQLYRSDKYTTVVSWQGPAWQHNVRAVVLTLEAARAVGRYGCAETGQQYTGFRAIGAGPRRLENDEGRDIIAPPAPTMTRIEAARALSELAGPRFPDQPGTTIPGSVIMSDQGAAVRAAKRAKGRHHPDGGGDRVLWEQVLEACRALGV